MVDGLGSLSSLGGIRERLSGSKVQFKVYHPVGLSGLRDIRQWFATLNRRNHRKSCVVDGEQAWVGSLNISEVHSESCSGSKTWRDTGIRVQGPEVLLISTAFEKAWRHNAALPIRQRRRRYRYLGYRALAWFRKPPTPGRHVLLNHTVRLRMRRHAELVGRITSAQRRVWLTTPYFVPGIQLLRSLRLAAACGADVRILLPSISDVPIVRWVGAVFEEGLLRVGVRIFHYKPSILHAKSVLIDDWATVGSSNLNHRSIIHDLEIDVVIDRQQLLDELAVRYSRDLELSDEATVESVRSRGWIGKLGGAFGMLLRYWM